MTSLPDSSGSSSPLPSSPPTTSSTLVTTNPTPMPSSDHFDIGYLHSWPLIGQFGGETPFIIKKLDFESEQKLLFDTLSKAQKKVGLSMEIATTDNLRRLVTVGCRAIHYTGHGMPSCLAFEDGEGKMHAVDAATLRQLVAAGGEMTVRFVFVSACHSEAAGKAFVDAGVPHVIAVRTEAQVCDKSAQMFMSSFYFSLLCGKTVKDAFDIAKQTVLAAPNVLNINETRKYLLLPETGDHRKVIFPDVERGLWIDHSPPSVLHNLPAIPESFLGRNFQMQKIIQVLSKRRLVSLSGPCGVGKSALAIATGRYIWKRGMFEGVFFVSLRTLAVQVSASIATVCCQSLQMDKVLNNNKDFLNLIRNKKYLLIFDEADVCLCQPAGESRDITTFINELLRICPSVKVIITSIEKLEGIMEVVNNVVPVAPLSPLEAAQLFYDLKPRDLPLKEFGCDDPQRAAPTLSSHKALQLLSGHPRRIFNAAPLLAHSNVKMSDLPPLIEQQIKDEEAGKCLGACRFRRQYQQMQAQQSETMGGHHHMMISTSMPANMSSMVPHAEESSAAPMANGGAAGSFMGSHLHPHTPNPLLPVSPPHNMNSVSFASPMPAPSPSPVSPFSSHPPNGAHSSSNIVSDEGLSPFDYALHTSLRGDKEAIALWKSFGDVQEVKWSEFVQPLQTHFVSICGVAERPLSPDDFLTIQGKMIQLERRRDVVSLSSFAAFWPWFTAIESSIQKIRSIWIITQPHKLVHGLINRDQAMQILMNNGTGISPVGTFLLRLSDSSPGNIAVGFVDPTERIQHTLIECVNQRGFQITLKDGTRVYETLEELLLKCKVFVTLHPNIDKVAVFSQEEDQPN